MHDTYRSNNDNSTFIDKVVSNTVAFIDSKKLKEVKKQADILKKKQEYLEKNRISILKTVEKIKSLIIKESKNGKTYAKYCPFLIISVKSWILKANSIIKILESEGFDCNFHNNFIVVDWRGKLIQSLDKGNNDA